jgi:dTDP-glucose 4,6-dehydratase
LVEGIYRLLMSDYDQPVNIGNPSEITMLQFADEIMALVGNPKAHIDFRPLPTDDPKQRQPNITKAREILGWEPQYDRAKGLAITYEYFKKAVKV